MLLLSVNLGAPFSTLAAPQVATPGATASPVTASPPPRATATPATSAPRAPTAVATAIPRGATPTRPGQHAGSASPAASPSGTVLLARGSSWQSSFDQATWTTGPAPFANPNGCPGVTPGTNWLLTDPDTIYLKKTLTLAAPATGAVASVMIDDQITLTINGQQIGFFDSATCGTYFNHQFAIPDGVLHAGDNLVAVTAVNIPSRLPNNKSVDVEITGNLGASSADATFGECAPYRGCSRDPVDTATGNLIYQHTDLAIPGRGGGVVFARAYNSLDSRGGALGPGWTSSDAAHVVDQSPTIQVVRWNGRTDRYTQNGTSYAPPPGVFDTLQKVSQPEGTVWLLTQTDQSQLGFDASGKLLSLKDRNGNQTTLGYDASGRLTTISDPAGRGALTLG